MAAYTQKDPGKVQRVRLRICQGTGRRLRHWWMPMIFKLIKDLKPGEYIKRTESAEASYIKEHYDRATKTFCCSDVDDMNRSIFIKANKAVFVGFDY